MELILVVNCGSSSCKCSLYNEKSPEPIWYARLEWKEGFRDAHLTVETAGIDQELTIHSVEEGLERLFQTLPKDNIGAIGHRVVHGGEVFHEITLIEASVKKGIEEIASLAPLHNPANLAGIATTEALFPGLPQYAVFDTAFHHTLSEAAATYPLPYALRQKGLRRYGFHGISHAYCSKRTAAHLGHKGRIVVCHLGGGASLCAVEGGKSIDTTMGMTPLEGLMMASRSGSVDPGLLLYLMKHENLSTTSLDHMLNKESGLLGISGISEDLRDIHRAAAGGNQRAQHALDLFVHILARHIGMMTASLKGIDALTFTAGIGENDAEVREKACEPFSFLGLKIDPEKNRSPSRKEREISTTDSNVRVFVIPTREEWEIAQQVRAQLS